MTTCGLWPGQRNLIAVVADDDGRFAGPAGKGDYSDEGRWDLLSYIEGHHGLDCAFIVTDGFARADPIARLAVNRGARVWMVADQVIDDFRVLACSQNASPKQLALLLARTPLCLPLRPKLQIMRLQLPLFAPKSSDATSLCR
jgi:hypothetical protein